MKRLVVAILVAIPVALLAPAALAQTPPPPAATCEAIVKFAKADKLTIPTKETFLTFVMVPFTGGKPMTFIVYKVGAADAKVEANIKDFVTKCKPGDLFEVKYNIIDRSKELYSLQNIKPYTVRAGEDEPNVYVFVRAGNTMAGNVAVSTAEVAKYKKSSTFLVPMGKGPKGVADPKISAALAKFKPDDLVEVQATGGAAPVLRSIRLWEPPMEADYGKVVRKDEHWAVEVSDGPDTKSLLVDKKDMSLLGRVRPLKSGTAILYKADKDDKGVLWLVDVRVRPKNYVTPQREATAADPSTLPEKFGQFLECSKVKDPRTGDQLDAVRIRESGQENGTEADILYLIGAKDTATIMPKIGALKQGSTVAFRSVSDLGAGWLLDIRQSDPASQPAMPERRALFGGFAKGKFNNGQEVDVVKLLEETGPNTTAEKLFPIAADDFKTLQPVLAALKASAPVAYRLRAKDGSNWLISIHAVEGGGSTSAPATAPAAGSNENQKLFKD